MVSNQFNEEGISKLTGALDQDQLHGLKTVLDEMTDGWKATPALPVPPRTLRAA